MDKFGYRYEMASKLVENVDFNIALVSHPVAVIYLIEELEIEIIKGGVAQWLVNLSGSYAAQTIAALREVGANRSAEIVEEIVQLLQYTGDLGDEAGRVAAVMRAEEAVHFAWYRLGDELLADPDDLNSLQRRYIAAHQHEFVLDGAGV
ncbi:MAG: DUF4375 domain-containing protein [Deltaproteobacteria bacterium]|nr:DUF4375 domain-containing protein [Deltaproteobacteria bacterium]